MMKRFVSAKARPIDSKDLQVCIQCGANFEGSEGQGPCPSCKTGEATIGTTPDGGADDSEKD